MKESRASRKAVWVILCLLLAVAFVIAGLIAGNKNEGQPHSHDSASSPTSQIAEREFHEGWNHAVEEEQRERDESPSGESKWEELR